MLTTGHASTTKITKGILYEKNSTVCLGVAGRNWRSQTRQIQESRLFLLVLVIDPAKILHLMNPGKHWDIKLQSPDSIPT